MRLLLEISFRGVYYWLSDPMYRAFIGLVIRYGDQKRNRPQRIRLLGQSWLVLDAYSFIWQFREIFTDRSYAFPCTNPHPVIYDCGSNIGLSILYYSKYYPNCRVESFEPNPKVAEVLKQNTEGLKGCTINLHQEAVWIRDEVLAFGVEGDPDAGRIGDSTGAGRNGDPDAGRKGDPDAVAGTVQVQARDLRSMLDRESRVDFLKIDVEGAESAIIPHIMPCLHKVQSLFVEYHSRPGDPQALGTILRCLEEAGFRYYLKTENRRRQPLTNHGQELAMDYQTNVYAFRLGS
ncbi:MAG: FkbM family methyltransferase [Bacteroidota bacterium]